MALKHKITKYELIDWRKLIPFQPDELKKTTPALLEKLKRSLLKNGFGSPFYVWKRKDGLYCIDGHHRLRVISEMAANGTTVPDQLPACFLNIKNEAEAKKLLLSFNSHYANIQRGGFDTFIEGLDFDEIKLNFEPFKLGFNYPQPKVTEDEPPPVPVKPKSKLGDIYELGAHRVMCGDATEDIPLLMEGEKADMVFTDPPYGVKTVNVSSKKVGGGGETKFGSVGGGGFVDAKTYSEMIGDDTTETAAVFYAACKSLGVENFIIWGGNYFTDFLPPSPCWLVWDKQNTGNFADVEIAWSSSDKAAKMYRWLWNGLSRAGVRRSELATRVHPTQKPVGLFVDIFQDFLFDSCLDGFLGSGSTLIACEQTGRRCYGLELDPCYVDVIIQRWVNYTGQTRIKKNGEEIEWQADPQS